MRPSRVERQYPPLILWRLFATNVASMVTGGLVLMILWYVSLAAAMRP